MGNPEQTWTPEEEEEALCAGKRKDIQRDPEFDQFSNIDLKDKWRNMVGGGSGQDARDKSPGLETKATQDAPGTPDVQAPTAPVQDDASADVTVDGPSKAIDGGKSSTPRCNAFIFEALAALKEPNGSYIGDIFNYIERRHGVPQNLRRSLSSRLRRLVSQDKLEKVPNGYKLKEEAGVESTRMRPLREKDVRVRQQLPPPAT